MRVRRCGRGGILEMGAHLNACIHQPMLCWMERSWTSPHLSLGNYTHVYTCAQLPRSASAGPIAGRRPSTTSIPSKLEPTCRRKPHTCYTPVLSFPGQPPLGSLQEGDLLLLVSHQSRGLVLKKDTPSAEPVSTTSPMRHSCSHF